MTECKVNTSCYATIALILTVQMMYIIYTYVPIGYMLKNSGNVDSFVSPDTTQTSTFKGLSRPLDGYLLYISRVNEYCEPISYEREEFKTYRIQSCLDFLGKNESEYMFKPKDPTFTYEGRPMLFHVYWKGKLNDKISLMIKSFLYTQPLDSVLNVWLDSNNEDPTKSPYVTSFLRFISKNIQFHKWNATEQLSYDRIYKGWKEILKKTNKRSVVGYSDMVRFILLHRYGGLYVDADVLLLRDMRPLYHLNYEWSYRWSLFLMYNTAVLRIWKNSTTSQTIIAAAMENKMNFHPSKIRDYLTKREELTRSSVNEKLYMMPVAMFDPLWLKNDLSEEENQVMVPNLSKFEDVFTPSLFENEFPGVNETVAKNTTGASVENWRKKEKFFNGAFTYHWHNRWNRHIYSTSWMGILEKGYEDFLKGQGTNLYGEYVTV